MRFGASRLAGEGFRRVFGTIKAIRPDRPIHPAGVALTGVVECLPAGRASGVSWLDTPGTAPVQARLSRAAGLPKALPDVLGLALRVADGAGSFDILFSSTGLSRPGRFLLLPRRKVSGAAFSTLMPYKGTRGPVLLAARTLGSAAPLPSPPEDFRRALRGRTWTLALYHARPWGRWQRFGTLSLGLDPARPDTGLRFDPVLHPLPGAAVYEWTRLLREPAYSRAREPAPPE
ncbi:hypothetical protein [Arthrobacter mobilis]|uniref:Phosphodiesterase n=1 Tax=Arthrobacter mobilis TaxID=2724944 RepID=A0A7X6HD19_9MICC|nr:hypothetical protein [Arthrobacter mobilis]NKX54285.1 hypothetical protein [Arthrobacter mobilis]